MAEPNVALSWRAPNPSLETDMTKDSTFFEKLALLSLAAMAIVALSVIAILALRSTGLDPNAAGMIGVIVGGLIAVAKDIVAAVRSYAMSAQLGKVTDQLAASGPVVDPNTPQPVVVTNPPADPVPVEPAP